MANTISTGAARQYTNNVLGGPVTEIESTPTIASNAATSILPNNGDRVGVVIVNLSTSTVYISFNSAVNATNGILLGPSGGSLSLEVTEDFTLPSRQLWGYCVNATAQLYVLELTRYDLNRDKG
jgi:hypothetical protein